jgi:hypothetical protein
MLCKGCHVSLTSKLSEKYILSFNCNFLLTLPYKPLTQL